MSDDRRLIEDYLPIQAISAEASREKSVRKGHISTLHLWWARRPLVACRAAVYGALVPADQWVQDVELKNPPDDPVKAEAKKNGTKKGLNRRQAKEFVSALCKYPGEPRIIAEAQRHILTAHAKRLTEELAEGRKNGKMPAWVEESRFKGQQVTTEDIMAGRAPRPRVLDMFAGGGAIPLEALRLGCEAYALDLNPVAYIIELCTLVYPQKYGKPDANARGMTGLPAPRRYWVYVIRCEDDSFYIGQTDNILRRYEDHLSGKAEWTATHKPVELTHWEEFKTREEAVAREQELKTGFGRKWLKREWDVGRLASRQAGPKNAKGLPASLEGLAQPGETTWGGLAEEVRYWGKWVLQKMKTEIGDLYPPIPDPKAGKVRKTLKSPQMKMAGEGFDKPGQQELATDTPLGYLTPVAYLWTRTVKCKNPACGATVPLVKQTWLCKKDKRYVALRVVAPRGQKQVRFEVVEATTEKGLGFDPSDFSSGGSATCPFCNAVTDSDYVKAEGVAARIGQQFMAAAATKDGTAGKVYLAAGDLPAEYVPKDSAILKRLVELQKKYDIPPLEEAIEANPRSMDIDRAGFTKWGQLFTPREQLALTCLCAYVRAAENEMKRLGSGEDASQAVTSMLGCGASKFADFCSTLCTFNYTGGRGVIHSFPQQSLPMVWDFAETNPFNPDGASWIAIIEDNPAVIELLQDVSLVGSVQRGSAVSLPWSDGTVDAVVTDPPYYDNVSYSNLSDFFYLWLRRSIGHLYPEHFAMTASPKKAEIIAASYRHGGDKGKSKAFYETMMEKTFAEAHRVLKANGEMAVVYAHKTTLGWSTLVDALRRAGFVVTEAWPLDTERKGRVIAMDTAALASSIFLVARKRDANAGTGSYETDVRPELERVVRERVETLWEMEIMGADLVIACVGAGLRAFTRYGRVEFANGEEAPAERFLTEVETVVLETILERLSKEVGGNGSQQRNLAGVDPATRFYILWRYTYRAAELDAGEAIIFANGTHVELDGPHGLCAGGRALVEKKKAKYRLRDYTERGDDDKLGLLGENGQPAPLVDTLHRMLWLMDRKPAGLTDFLQEARPNLEQIRLVAQALAGPALKGGELGQVSAGAEAAALGRLTANWRSLTEGVGPLLGGRKR